MSKQLKLMIFAHFSSIHILFECELNVLKTCSQNHSPNFGSDSQKWVKIFLEEHKHFLRNFFENFKTKSHNFSLIFIDFSRFLFEIDQMLLISPNSGCFKHPELGEIIQQMCQTLSCFAPWSLKCVF
jgi:hypothetical protein